jgi:hypothetical protein
VNDVDPAIAKKALKKTMRTAIAAEIERLKALAREY